jgi:hypothetical protein
VIKLVIDTKTFGLKVQPKLDNNLGWDLKIFCDSNWAGDPETRVSVMGFIIYLLNVPICWHSKSQKGVTLSSTEAEYFAISEAVKELKFIYYLLTDLHINWHVYTGYHFVREFIEDGFIKIKFVRSVENDFDLSFIYKER